MARKKVGHIELQWTCPNCGGVNPGPVKVCGNCGAPQPEDVKFEQRDRQVLITEKDEIAKAEAGADIHCPYCSTRNPAGTKVCSRCGGDLSEGKVRQAGEVLGAFKTGPATNVRCPTCGAENPDTASTCSQCGGSLRIQKPEVPRQDAPVKPVKAKPRTGILVAIGAFLVLVCGALALLAVLSSKTAAVAGTVQSASWERSIPIEVLTPVDYHDWDDQIPQGAEVGACEERVRAIQDEPAPNAVEVCGTPYNVDTGGGYAEVVQDCEYQVYDSFCTYSVDEWRQVDSTVLSGSDYSPIWPEPSLQAGQRLGDNRNESYSISFSAGDKTYTFQTSDYSLFQQASIGSQWRLNINTFGAVASIEK